MANTYYLIASTTVGAGGASTIDFTSIPSTYTDLLIMTSTRSSQSTSTNQGLAIQFNSNTSSYSNRAVFFQDSVGVRSASNLYGVTDKTIEGGVPAASNTANTFDNTSIYIPNYASSNYKGYSADNATNTNSTTDYTYNLQLTANLWSNTAAISSISLFLVSGNFVQYSSAYLYGIKNS